MDSEIFLTIVRHFQLPNQFWFRGDMRPVALAEIILVDAIAEAGGKLPDAGALILATARLSARISRCQSAMIDGQFAANHAFGEWLAQTGMTGESDGYKAAAEDWSAQNDRPIADAYLRSFLETDADLPEVVRSDLRDALEAGDDPEPTMRK